MLDLLDKLEIDEIVSHRQADKLKESILKQVMHIHPRDYNFIIKDGNHLQRIIKQEELKLEDESTDDLKAMANEKNNISTHVQAKETLKGKNKKNSNTFRDGSSKARRKQLGKAYEQVKKDNQNKVDVFLSHVKNNLSVFTNPKNENMTKKSKQKKRPSSSDNRKFKKGATNKLIDMDPLAHEVTTPHDFYDTL